MTPTPVCHNTHSRTGSFTTISLLDAEKPVDATVLTVLLLSIFFSGGLEAMFRVRTQVSVGLLWGATGARCLFSLHSRNSRGHGVSWERDVKSKGDGHFFILTATAIL